MSEAENVRVDIELDVDPFEAACRKLGETMKEWVDGLADIGCEQMLNAFFFHEHLQNCVVCYQADRGMPDELQPVTRYVEKIHTVGYCGFGKYLEMVEVRRLTRE